MSDGKGAVVQTVEAASAKSAVDRIVTEAKGDELRTLHDAVLPLR